MSFDQSTGLQSVQDARKGDRLDLKKLCQSALVDPFVPSQIGQRLPLRSGQLEVARNLFEFLSNLATSCSRKPSVGKSRSTTLVTPTLAYHKLAYKNDKLAYKKIQVTLLHDRACSPIRECGAAGVAAILRQRLAMFGCDRSENRAACGADGFPDGATVKRAAISRSRLGTRWYSRTKVAHQNDDL
jgi:hypothetical protein